MTSSQSKTGTPQVAVWYFVGATVLFAASALFVPDAEFWVRIVLVVAGFLVIVAGGVQLGREMGRAKDARDAAAAADPDPAEDT